ncbi:protein phosphatase 1K, mitochondrial [Etheostoma cragini]|uniref:protein phosphatase 1K, mitochondrial n=1 Tax=Etheostoma cragini TaxID=417921 RepID=UPI00155E673A|nr:protein phosphatase 1K, mitochondrial [Etheostoma cragini]
MSSSALLNLLRCGRSAVARQPFLTVRSSPGTPPASGQVIHSCIDPSQVSLSRVGSASVLGLRKQNEDRLRVARIHDDLLYFAVFDGHGGPHAADYCCTFMEKFIRDALEEDDDLEKVLKKAFFDVDKALHTHLSYFNNASFVTAGTTATVALLRDGVEVVVGSVGDSRALLCRKGRANKLTKDHTPDRKDERRRYAGYCQVVRPHDDPDQLLQQNRDRTQNHEFLRVAVDDLKLPNYTLSSSRPDGANAGWNKSMREESDYAFRPRSSPAL